MQILSFLIVMNMQYFYFLPKPSLIIGNETDVDIDAMDAETEGEEDTEE